MKTNGSAYSLIDSNERIREILDASNQSFEEVDSIPSAERLTYSNGFYVYCTALFIDIRDSSKLPESHSRPVLAKIYRSYLSECVAILNQDAKCKEIVINGDCVSGIFDTTTKGDIERAFFHAAELNALLKLFNLRLSQKGYQSIKCGIGIDYGRALMLKAGFKGSSINETIWMGDVVNGASNLCHQGNKGLRLPIQLSVSVQQNISRADYLENISPVRENLWSSSEPTSYEADVLATYMDDWINQQ